MFSDSAGFLGRTTGVSLQNRLGQDGYKFTVFFLTCQRRATAGCRARGCVCDTFLLGFGQGFVGHQQTLPLVSFAFSVESHHHCRE